MYLFIFFCVHTYDEGVCERIEIEKQRKRERERETFIGNKCEERNILGLVSKRERPKVMPFRHDFTGFFRLRQNMQNRKKWPQEVAIEWTKWIAQEILYGGSELADNLANEVWRFLELVVDAHVHIPKALSVLYISGMAQHLRIYLYVHIYMYI